MHKLVCERNRARKSHDKNEKYEIYENIFPHTKRHLSRLKNATVGRGFMAHPAIYETKLPSRATRLDQASGSSECVLDLSASGVETHGKVWICSIACE